MRERLRSLPGVGLASLLMLLVLASPAWAHRLIVKCKVLPGSRVQVESYYDTGDAPPRGLIRVFRPDDQLLVEGRLDPRGLCVLTILWPEELRVTVSDGGGHRAEARVSAKELENNYPLGKLAVACFAPPATPLTALPALAAATEHAHLPRANSDSPPEEHSHSDRAGPTPWRDILNGVAFLLALAAFIISVQNARTLRELREALASGGRKPPETQGAYAPRSPKEP